MGVGLCTISAAMKVIFLRNLTRQGPKISYWILHASDSIFRHSKVHKVREMGQQCPNLSFMGGI